MNSTMRLGWLSIALCVVIALWMIVSARLAHAEAVTLVDRVEALVPRFASKKVEPVNAHEFAVAVDTACEHDRSCAADLTTVAIHEGGLSAAVARNEFLPHQGDAYVDKGGVRHHRAAGLWQAWKNKQNADVWGSTDLLLQARDARRMLRQAVARCAPFRNVPRDVGMFRGYSGRLCVMPLKGEEQRLQTLAIVRRSL